MPQTVSEHIDTLKQLTLDLQSQVHAPGNLDFRKQMGALNEARDNAQAFYNTLTDTGDQAMLLGAIEAARKEVDNAWEELTS